MSFGVDCRRSSDLALLWLWCGPKAIAPIQPLVWEPPLPCGPKKQENKTKQNKKNPRNKWYFCLYFFNLASLKYQ